ncbi:hypothetical protein [Variovorax guangxiensis]|uniref:hypothetical protein n=1 Tax=Variovorax guangxiensis TaxID=1775474 RepID=UPI0028589B52|nr:hypothetical protein [Variovorax guangxiensis]MDR6860707.1 hypothetical protein [Variovorax guangxiensis]
MNVQLRHVETNQDIHAAFAVMRELRPHLVNVDAFIAQVRRQAHGNSRGQRFYFRQGLLSRALHFDQALSKE